MNRDSRIVELLHDVANKGWHITLNADFKGMLTLSLDDGSHYHLGDPYGSMKTLEKALINKLSDLMEYEHVTD